MRAALPAALLAALALAGCSGDGGAPAAAGPPTASAGPAAPAAAPPPPAVHAARCDDQTGLSYGAAGLGGSGDPAECPLSEAFGGDLSALQGALVEVTWLPAPTVTGAQLLLQSDSCWRGMALQPDGTLEQGACDQGNAQAASPPLRVEVAADLLARYGADNMTAMVLAQGATTGHAFTIHVTLFEAGVPPGYSALDGA